MGQVVFSEPDLLSVFQCLAPSCILQAQRDFFGSHTYERNDGKEGWFHTGGWCRRRRREQGPAAEMLGTRLQFQGTALPVVPAENRVAADMSPTVVAPAMALYLPG